MSEPVTTPRLGGTGSNTPPSTGQIPIGTSGGNYEPAGLTAGDGILVTPGSGSIDLAVDPVKLIVNALIFG